MADFHFPQYHVRLPRGYVNDPNGPIDVDGRAHLYFQSRPQVDLQVPVEWGHAISDDLVHWTLQRPAIVPLPGGADSGGAWSGNTIYHDGYVRAYYSGKVDDNVYQSVLMAVSTDGGATFGPPVQVVADPGHDEGVTMFRDPFVWKVTDGWRMGVGAAEAGETASIRLYQSVDGVHWEAAGHLAALGRADTITVDTGEGWECPQVLAFDGSEIAIVGAWSHEDGPGNVIAFALDEPIRPDKVDDGQNFYAASVMRDSSWGPVLFGWVTEGRDAAWTESAGWSGAISMPRRAWLQRGRFGSEPHPALEALRLGDHEPANDAIVGAQSEMIVPEAITGRIRLSFSDTEHVDIYLDAERDTLTIDRNAASSDDRAHRGEATAHHAFDSTASRPALRLFVDGSIIEAFTSSGRVITTRVYPTQAPPWTLEAPREAKVWHLRPAVGTLPAERARTQSSPSLA